jgi:hypothetical protein
MSSEEIDTDNSENSRSDVSSLDTGFTKMQVESSSSEEDVSVAMKRIDNNNQEKQVQ